jgi:PEP-CTERM motif
MNSAGRGCRMIWVAGILACAVFFALAPIASADTAFQTTANASIGLNGSQGVACNQSAGGTSQTAASANCAFGGASASGSVDMISGGSTVAATDNGIDTPADGSVGWVVGGIIGGSGRIILSDSGIAWTTSGGDPGGVLTLGISDPTAFNSNSVCDSTSGAAGCLTSSSVSTTLAVSNGDQLYLSFGMTCGAALTASCTMSDAITLTLSPGLTLTTGVHDFLSGPPSATPEPGTLPLFGTGLVGLGLLAKRLGATKNTVASA